MQSIHRRVALAVGLAGLLLASSIVAGGAIAGGSSAVETTGDPSAPAVQAAEMDTVEADTGLAEATGGADAARTEQGPSVTIVDDAPARASPGDTIALNVTVSGAIDISVVATSSFDKPNETNLTVDRETWSYGQPYKTGNETVPIEVTTSDDYVGRVGLRIKANSQDGVAVTETRTDVYGSVVTVPATTGNRSLSDVLSVASANATVRLQNETFQVDATGTDRDDPALVVGKNVTLTSAPDAAPTIQFVNATEDSVALELAGARTTLAGVELRGDGNGTLVASSGDDTEIRNATLRNAEHGVHVDDGEGATVVDNEIQDVERGIVTTDAAEVAEIRENDVTNATVNAIEAAGPVGEVVGNDIDGFGEYGIFVWGTNDSEVAHNRVDSGNGSAGILLFRTDGGTVARNDVNVSGEELSIYAGLSSGVEIEANEIARSPLVVDGSSDVAVVDTSVANTSVGVIVVGSRANGTMEVRSRNVSVANTSTAGVANPVEVRSGTRSVTVEHPAATARFHGLPGDVEGLTLADGTTISADATNASIGLGSSHTPIPENRTQIGPTLAFEAEGSDARIDRLDVDLSEEVLSGVEDGSVDLVANESGNWSSVGNASVAGGSVTVANVSTFGSVAILGTPDEGGGGGGGPVFVPAPPGSGSSSSELSIASIDLERDTATAGESVAVDVRIENDGDAAGEYEATLTVSGEVVTSRTVSVNANWHETVTLSASFDEPGTYELVVDGQPAGTVTVEGEAQLELADTDVEAATVAPGETVEITATVENHGAVAGSTPLHLVVDEELAATTTVTVPGDDAETVTFEHTFETAGSYPIAIAGQRVGIVAVEEPERDGGSDGTPGFGVGIAVVGLLSGIAARRRLGR